MDGLGIKIDRFEATAKSNNQKIIRFHGKLYIYISFLILAAVLSACSDYPNRLFRFKPYKFPAKSMAPTLLPGERILVDLQYYRDHKPERGDIIVFEYPKDPAKDFLKRVIAIEKDVVKGEGRKIFLNGQPLEEPYVQHTRNEIAKEMDNFGPVTVPRGTVFVMGDNRDESLDSRLFGVVSVEKVKGRVLYIYWSKKWSRIATKVE